MKQINKYNIFENIFLSTKLNIIYNAIFYLIINMIQYFNILLLNNFNNSNYINTNFKKKEQNKTIKFFL